MNEVSNGPSGNKEYVEFVVIDTVVSYDCGATTPPCIDIRQWIFDDNSGYHGAGGIAAGAVRFANDPLWSCVPLGTIILIYNDADPNPDVPAIDVSVTDGNCRIVVPISSPLFETNLTTPGAIACSYPPTGWTSGGNWSTTLMANTGDCARIVNLAGCEVFSVCWASCSTSTLIYFNSTGSGTDNVWYFNDGNPNDQVNWSEGCADATACGVNEQSPGLPNNGANAAYIAQFNNGCVPITPIFSSIASSTNAGCSCDGTATASGSGSIPGYTYEWFDNSFIALGQSSDVATGLCAGTYHVIVTSVIGCSDTSSVTISSTGTTPVISISPISATICEGDSVELTASGAATYTWSPSPGLSSTSGTIVNAAPLTTITYTVTGEDLSGCTGMETITINVNPLPILSVNSGAICPNDTISLAASGADTFHWLPSTGLSADTGSTVNAFPLTTSTYSLVGENSFGCKDTITTTVTVHPAVTVTVNSDTICSGETAILTASGAVNYEWSPSSGLSSVTGSTVNANPSSNMVYTVIGESLEGCLDTVFSSVIVVSGVAPVIDPSGAICENAAPIALTASPSGGTWSGTGVNSSGIFNPSVAGSGIVPIIYTIGGSSSCSGSDTLFVQVDDLVLADIDSLPSICVSSLPVTLTASPAGGLWSGSGITSASSGTFEPSLPGIYTVNYEITNGSCQDMATIAITVTEDPVVDLLISGPTTFCEGNSVTLSASASTFGTIQWSNGATTNSIVVTESGNYFVTLQNGCGTDTSTVVPVTVNTIDASFTLTPSEGQSPLTVSIVNTTSGTFYYYWNMYDSLTVSDKDTTMIFELPGTYPITIYVTSVDGCVDSLTQFVTVYGEFNLVVPNIMTANGDGTNDSFILLTTGIKEVEMMIYNRWGQLIMSENFDKLADGRTTVWDGKLNGDPVSEGTYAYIIKAIGFAGEEKTVNGFLTLIRK